MDSVIADIHSNGKPNARLVTWEIHNWDWDGTALVAKPLNSASESLQPHSLNSLKEDTPLNSSSSDTGAPNVSSTDYVEASSVQGKTVSDAAVGILSINGSDSDEPDCPNLRAGRVPCACTEADERLALKYVRRGRIGNVPKCQIPDCMADLSKVKEYHQRHHVCEDHAKALTVFLNEAAMRYCQQCGRFHPLSNFDKDKRSCRKKLERHNNRRRGLLKSQTVDMESVKSDDADLSSPSSLSKGSKRSKVSENSSLNSMEEKFDPLPPPLTDSHIHDSELSSKLNSNQNHSSPKLDYSLNSESIHPNVTVSESFPPLHSNIDHNPFPTSETSTPFPNSSSLSSSFQPNPIFPSIFSHTTDSNNSAMESMPTNSMNKYPLLPFHSPPPSAFSSPFNSTTPFTSNIPFSSSPFPKHAFSPKTQSSPSNFEFEHHPFPLPPLSHSSIPPATDNQTVKECAETQSLLALLMDDDVQNENEQMNVQSNDHVSSPFPIPMSSNLNFSSSLLNHPHPYPQPPHPTPTPTPFSFSTPTTSTLTPSFQSQSSSGRISFKLYDWNPGDFPRRLRHQIMEWLSLMPSDLEGYIRPGCTILDLHVNMTEASWKEFYDKFEEKINGLMIGSGKYFWSKGRMKVNYLHQFVFVNNGTISKAIQSKPDSFPHILSIRPLCILSHKEQQISVWGWNLNKFKIHYSNGGKFLLLNQSFKTKEEKEEDVFIPSIHVHDVENNDEYDKEKNSLYFHEGLCNKSNHGLSFQERKMDLPKTPLGLSHIEFESTEETMAGSNSLHFPLLVSSPDLYREISKIESINNDMLNDMIHEINVHGNDRIVHPSLLPSLPSFQRKEKEILHLLEEVGWILNKLSKNAYFSFSPPSPSLYMDEVGRLKALLSFFVERRFIELTKMVLEAAKLLHSEAMAAAFFSNVEQERALIRGVDIHGEEGEGEGTSGMMQEGKEREHGERETVQEDAKRKGRGLEEKEKGNEETEKKKGGARGEEDAKNKCVLNNDVLFSMHTNLGVDENGRNLLHVAMKKNDFDTVNGLLEFRNFPEASSPFWKEARKFRRTFWFDLAWRDEKGCNCFHRLALLHGHGCMIAFLCQKYSKEEIFHAWYQVLNWEAKSANELCSMDAKTLSYSSIVSHSMSSPLQCLQERKRNDDDNDEEEEEEDMSPCMTPMSVHSHEEVKFNDGDKEEKEEKEMGKKEEMDAFLSKPSSSSSSSVSSSSLLFSFASLSSLPSFLPSSLFSNKNEDVRIRIAEMENSNDVFLNEARFSVWSKPNSMNQKKKCGTVFDSRLGKTVTLFFTMLLVVCTLVCILIVHPKRASHVFTHAMHVCMQYFHPPCP